MHICVATAGAVGRVAQEGVHDYMSVAWHNLAQILVLEGSEEPCLHAVVCCPNWLVEGWQRPVTTAGDASNQWQWPMPIL